MKLQTTTQLWVSACLLVLPFATACDPETDDYLPDPQRPCTHFLRCVNGNSVAIECSPSTVYRGRGVCDHPRNVPQCANEKHEPKLGREEYIQPPLRHQTESGESNIKPSWGSAPRQQPQWNDEQSPKWNNRQPAQTQRPTWNNGRPGQTQPQQWNNEQPAQPQRPTTWNNGHPGQKQPQQWDNEQPARPQRPAWNDRKPGQNQLPNWNNGQPAQNQRYNWNNERDNGHY